MRGHCLCIFIAVFKKKGGGRLFLFRFLLNNSLAIESLNNVSATLITEVTKKKQV